MQAKFSEVKELEQRIYDLENELKSNFKISYQSVNEIIRAFYTNGQWTNVCTWFARAQEPAVPVELQHIARGEKRRL